MFRYLSHLWSSLHSKIISQALCQSWCWRSWTSSSIGRSPEPQRPTTTYHRLIAGETIGTAVKRRMVSWGNTVWCFPAKWNPGGNIWLLCISANPSVASDANSYLIFPSLWAKSCIWKTNAPLAHRYATFLCSLDVEIYVTISLGIGQLNSAPPRRDGTMARLLMAIVVVFLCCHSTKIIVNFYEAVQVILRQRWWWWWLWTI